MIDGYYYLHTNGDLIYKRALDDETVADFRESDFVVAFWPVDTRLRENAWNLLIEAKSLGADSSRIRELADKWHCDDKDANIYAERYGVYLSIDGDHCCATRKDFVNLQENPAGFGYTYLEAMADLCRQLGYVADKSGWGKTFIDLLK